METTTQGPAAEPRRLSITPPQAAAERLGVSLRTLQRMVKRGAAPAPVKIAGSHRIGFLSHELDELIAGLPRTRGSAQAA